MTDRTARPRHRADGHSMTPVSARRVAALARRGVPAVAAAALTVGFAPPSDPTAEATDPIPSPETAAAPVGQSGEHVAAVLDVAYRYIGTPYVYGGATPAGFDCSGFTQYVFAQVGIDLPRTSTEQRHAGPVVPASGARPGDLVWWPGHVGIYVGGGDYIAAHSPGAPLSVRPVFQSDPMFIRVA